MKFPDDLVEVVARALCAACGDSWDSMLEHYDDLPETTCSYVPVREDYRDQAVHALTAFVGWAKPENVTPAMRLAFASHVGTADGIAAALRALGEP